MYLKTKDWSFNPEPCTYFTWKSMSRMSQTLLVAENFASKSYLMRRLNSQLWKNTDDLICERGTRPWPHHRSIRSPRDPKRGRMRKSVKVSQRPRKGRERQSKAAQTLAQRLQRPGRGEQRPGEARQRPGRARGRGGGQKLKLLSPDARLTHWGRLRLGKPELNNTAFSFSQTFSMGQRYIDAWIIFVISPTLQQKRVWFSLSFDFNHKLIS